MIEQLKTLHKFVDRVPHKPSCALRHHADNFCDCGKQETLTTLSELERMVGEPVLVVEREPDYMNRGHYHEGTKPYIDPTKVWGLPIGTKLYAAPAAQQQDDQTPDRYCVTHADGSCISTDPRCMHNRPPH